jgi:single-strand DNA-binding protein
MNEISIHGNVGSAPKISHGRNNGIAVVNFAVAINSRRFDRARGEWVSRPTVWRDIVCFGDLATNVYDTIAKGTTVTVTGIEADDSYTREAREPGGEDIVIRRIKIEATDVAVSLRYATATVTKVNRTDTRRPDTGTPAEGQPALTVVSGN